MQLIHAATDTHLWAREYERELTDILKLQGEVARAVAEEIQVQAHGRGACPAGIGWRGQSGGATRSICWVSTISGG